MSNLMIAWTAFVVGVCAGVVLVWVVDWCYWHGR